MPLETKLLEIRDLTKVYSLGGGFTRKKLVAVDRANLEILEGRPEIYTIAGESGSGKSTIAKMLLGMVAPTSGSILYRGKDMHGKKTRQENLGFMKEIQPVFQNPFETFNPLKKVDSYLHETAMNYHMSESPSGRLEAIDEALALVGLNMEDVAGKFPNEFSGGQLQRISIARALITKPSFLIADEPVSMVDASLRMSITNLFKKLNEETGVNIIYITHDLATAYYVSHHIAVMLRGNIVERGPAEEVLRNPQHPYTRTLISSVPTPDPEHPWKEDIILSRLEEEEYSMAGCKFAERCAHCSERCRKEVPDYIFSGEVAIKCHTLH